MLRLSLADAQVAKVLAGQVVARIAPDAQVAFGFSQGADGLVAQLQGQSQPAFLIARAPGDDQGFGQDDVISTVWYRRFGRWGVAASAEHGSPVTAAPVWSSISGLDRRRYDSADRFGLSVNRGFGNVDLAFGASWLAERQSILGARLAEGFGGSGADSLFIDARGQWEPASGWRLGAAWRTGFTTPRSGGSIAAGGRMTSSAWSFDAAHTDVFKPGDWLGLRVSQPLRVERGGIALNLPVDYSYATLHRLSRDQCSTWPRMGARWTPNSPGAARCGLARRCSACSTAPIPDTTQVCRMTRGWPSPGASSSSVQAPALTAKSQARSASGLTRSLCSLAWLELAVPSITRFLMPCRMPVRRKKL